MFNIILPKPCEIFAKFLLKICQKFGKDFTRFFNKYNCGTYDRMIYFRENSIVGEQFRQNSSSNPILPIIGLHTED